MDVIITKKKIISLLKWGISSVGRAFGWQPKGHRFEPVILHKKLMLKKSPNPFVLLLFLMFCFWAGYSFCASNQPYKACVIPVKGMVDKGLSGFIVRAISEAEKAGCQYAIFEIDTFGGRVDAAVEIRDAILDAPFEQTVAYINKRAISAGALIALSSKVIYMAEGATIGAAQPVQIGGTGQSQAVGEKYVSYLRKEFKATAEKNGYPPEIAEAFVDSDVEIEGLIEKGKLLTLTSQEAKKNKLIKSIIPTREAVLERLGIAQEEVFHYSMTWSEVLVRILTHPVISSLLLTFGFLGMIFELRMPGFGVSGMIGLACLALFFLGHYLIGMAEWFDILIFVIGVVLIFLEILVFPGFGMAGIIGTICILVSLFLSLVKKEIPSVPVPAIDIMNALTIMGGAFFLAAGGMIIGFYFFPNSSFGRKLFLSRTLKRQSGKDAAASGPEYDLVGKTGQVHTTLRPAGKAMINGTLYDVVSYDEFIEKGTDIIVKEATQSRIVVEKKEGD